MLKLTRIFSSIAIITAFTISSIGVVYAAVVDALNNPYNKYGEITTYVELYEEEEEEIIEVAEIIEQPVIEEINEPEPITEYIVNNGDNLWNIAKKVYGDGSLYPFIVKSNNLANENVYIGQILKIEYDMDKSIISEYHNSKKSVAVFNNTSNTRNGIIPASMTYVGNYKITGYDAYCKHCCGKNDGITASGTKAKAGRTIAAKGFKYGTKLYIEGYGTYTVEDTGGFNPSVIDIVGVNHEECYTLTNNNVKVYVVN